jgi:hypothetical protein
MSEAQPAAVPLVLTPSERVLLFADHFAKPAGMLGDKEPALLSEVKVGADELAEKVLLAAFLACERAGAIRLEARQGKALFGLMKTNHLHVLPGTRPVQWPQGSLESWVVQGAQREPKLEDAAQPLLGSEKSYQPASAMFARLKAVLAERGILDAEQKKTLKIFTSVTYSVPARVRDALQPSEVGDVKAVLAACEQQRPEVWSAMQRGIRAAISRMTADAPDNS